MISLTQAEELIQSRFAPIPATVCATDAACGHTVAADIEAQLTQPRWPQVAMDGYALMRGSDASPRWQVQEGCAAAGLPQQSVREGHALRTTTGAPLPHGADTVVIQENARIDDGVLTLEDKSEPGANVRPAGEDFSHGEVLVSAGDLVTPGMVALLHHAGVSSLKVYPQPRIGIVVTGSELASSKANIAEHQTPDSNGPFLAAFANENGCTASVLHCDESPSALAAQLRTLESCADILVVCGGASVGPRDGSHAGLLELGAGLVFSKVAQKPGKPMALYIWNNRPVLLLPGNPAAVYCCTYWHLLPLLARLKGCAFQTQQLVLDSPPPKVGGRSLILRARARITESGEVHAKLLGGQLSHLLSSAAHCNALLRFDPGISYSRGDAVRGRLLRSFYA